MAEWGFTDVATAEAYYKRQQRQKAGSNAKRMEAKNRDPAVRLRNLQEAIMAQPKQLRGQELGLRPHQMHGPILPLHHPSLSPPSDCGSGHGSSSVVGVNTSPTSSSLPPRVAAPQGVSSSFSWSKVETASASTVAAAGGRAGGVGGSSAFLPRSLSQGVQLHQQPHKHNNHDHHPGGQNSITCDSPRTSVPLYGSINLMSDRALGLRQRSDPSSGNVTADDDKLSIHSFQSAGGMGSGQGRRVTHPGPWARDQGDELLGVDSVVGAPWQQQQQPKQQQHHRQQQQEERRILGRTLLPAMAQNWVLGSEAGKVNGEGGRVVIKKLENHGPVSVGGLGGVGGVSNAVDARDMAHRSLAAAERLERKARVFVQKT